MQGLEGSSDENSGVLGIGKAYDRQDVEYPLKRGWRVPFKGRCRMGKEGTETVHLGGKASRQEDVINDVGRCLSGKTQKGTGGHDIADVAGLLYVGKARSEGKPGVEPGIQGGIARLKAQKEPSSSCLVKFRERFKADLPTAHEDEHRVTPSYLSKEGHKAGKGKTRVLATLQHKSLETKAFCSFTYGFKDFFVSHAVSRETSVVHGNATVQAIAVTNVREFENTMDTAGVPQILPAQEIRHFVEEFPFLRRTEFKEVEEFLPGKRSPLENPLKKKEGPPVCPPLQKTDSTQTQIELLKLEKGLLPDCKDFLRLVWGNDSNDEASLSVHVIPWMQAGDITIGLLSLPKVLNDDASPLNRHYPARNGVAQKASLSLKGHQTQLSLCALLDDELCPFKNCS
jgi:hypothetical protein